MAEHPSNAATNDHRRPRTWPVWATLVGAPIILSLPFIPVVAYLALVHGYDGVVLASAVEKVAAGPATLGFGLILVLTKRMASRDRLSALAMGWTTPRWPQLFTGLGCGALVASLNQAWLYPAIQHYQPTFDPAIRSVPLIGAVVMMMVAVAAEDSLYRGYALVRLRARYGVVPAVVATSVFYALLTPGPDLALKVWALAFGIVLSTVRLWTGSLWPVVVAHFFVALSPRVLWSLSINT